MPATAAAKKPTSAERGFTLYEVLLYIALSTATSVLIVGLVMQLLQSGYRARRSREVFASVANAFQAIIETARFARSVYTPTSVFSSDTGQLSLESAVQPPPGETSTYVDFYLDNGRLFMKRESHSSQALTSEQVLITRFRVMRLNPVLASESLRVAIAGLHRFGRAREDTGFAATSTVTLRRY